MPTMKFFCRCSSSSKMAATLPHLQGQHIASAQAETSGGVEAHIRRGLMCACTGQQCNAKQILNLRPGCCCLPMAVQREWQSLASALAPASSHSCESLNPLAALTHL